MDLSDDQEAAETLIALAQEGDSGAVPACIESALAFVASLPIARPFCNERAQGRTSYLNTLLNRWREHGYPSFSALSQEIENVLLAHAGSNSERRAVAEDLLAIWNVLRRKCTKVKTAQVSSTKECALLKAEIANLRLQQQTVWRAACAHSAQKNQGAAHISALPLQLDAARKEASEKQARIQTLCDALHAAEKRASDAQAAMDGLEGRLWWKYQAESAQAEAALAAAEQRATDAAAASARLQLQMDEMAAKHQAAMASVEEDLAATRARASAAFVLNLKRELKSAQERLAAAEAASARSQQQLKDSAAEHRAAMTSKEQDLAAAQAKAAEHAASVASLENQLASAETRAATAEAASMRLQQELQGMAAKHCVEMTNIQRDLAACRERATTAEDSVTKLKYDLAATQDRADGTEDALEAATAELARAKLSAANRECCDAEASQKSAIARLECDLAAAQCRAKEASGRLSALEKEHSVAVGDLLHAIAKLKDARTQAKADKGTIRRLEGDLAAARRRADESADCLSAVEGKLKAAEARIACVEGDREQAMTDLREAISRLCLEYNVPCNSAHWRCEASARLLVLDLLRSALRAVSDLSKRLELAEQELAQCNAGSFEHKRKARLLGVGMAESE